MTQPFLFTLATFGTSNLGYRGLFSARHDNGTFEDLLDRINGELERLPRAETDSRARSAALTVLRRHGFGAPNAGGWFSRPYRPREG